MEEIKNGVNRNQESALITIPDDNSLTYGYQNGRVDLVNNNTTNPLQPATNVNTNNNGIIPCGCGIIPCNCSTTTLVVDNPNAYTGKALVMLTESPTYNLFGWASKTYQLDGNIKKMINRGVHTDVEWFNILFQLMTALYVMQIYGVVITDFSLENNTFIKDLSARGAITKYWKYIVDDVEYYIPNLGYLLLIDSNFRDLQNVPCSTVASRARSNVVPPASNKVNGKFIGQLSDPQIKDMTFEMFKNAFDPNTFGQSFIQNGGCPPSAEVKRVMGQIHAEACSDTVKNIGVYILKYMTMYLHNRVGTYLKETEFSTNIRKDDVRNFKKGQLLVQEDGFGNFKFVLFKQVVNGVATVITKDEPINVDFIEKVIPVTSLFNYSKAEPITQNFKPNEVNMNEEELLETYIIRP